MVIAPNCLIYRHAQKRQRSIDSHPPTGQKPEGQGKKLKMVILCFGIE